MTRTTCLVGGLAILVVARAPIHAQSHTAKLSVSAIVAPTCSIQSMGESSESQSAARMTLACSGRGANAVRLDVGPAHGPSPRVVADSRLEFRVALGPGDTLVTLQF